MALSQIDTHFLAMARMAGEKSQLSHSKRGAILAKGNKVLSQGVNAHLDQAAHLKPIDINQIEEEKYIATVHAEIVAVGAAIRAGLHLDGCTMYTSEEPVWHIWKTLVTLGIRRIVYYGPNKNSRIQHYAQALGVENIIVA